MHAEPAHNTQVPRSNVRSLSVYLFPTPFFFFRNMIAAEDGSPDDHVPESPLNIPESPLSSRSSTVQLVPTTGRAIPSASRARPSASAPLRTSSIAVLGHQQASCSSPPHGPQAVPQEPEGGFRGLPLGVTVTLVSGLFIIMVGLLSFIVPFFRLSASIDPLSVAVREQSISRVSQVVHKLWDGMHSRIMQEHLRWQMTGEQPVDALASGPQWTTFAYPLLMAEANIFAVPLVTESPDGCIRIWSVNKGPNNTLFVDLQNCTSRRHELYHPETHGLSGIKLRDAPVLNRVQVGFKYPTNMTTPQQPFTWEAISNPKANLGDLLKASVGLHGAGGRMIGRTSVATTTFYLRSFLAEIVEQEPTTAGGLLALYEPDGMVVAATHGDYNKNKRFHIEDIGDADLEKAARLLKAEHGTLCTKATLDFSGSRDYLLSTGVIKAAHASVYPLEWCALLLSPRENTFAIVDSARNFAAVFVTVMTLCIVFIAWIGTMYISSRSRKLATGMVALSRYDIHVARQSCGERSVFSEFHRQQASYDGLVGAMDAFGKYVPRAVVESILTGTIEPKLGMQEKSIAVLFMDMQNFTTMCESMAPQDMVTICSGIFDACVSIIWDFQGTIDKFIGDCIMAFWGAPLVLSSPCVKGTEAVLRTLRWLRENPHTTGDGTPIGFRMGLHWGAALVGNFGATNRWDYTAVGDVVNTGARLEPLNKQFGTNCLASAAVYRELSGCDLTNYLRPMGSVLLVGKKQPVTVYQILEDPLEEESMQSWTEAIDDFEAGRLGKAAEYFAARQHSDLPAQSLLEDIRDQQGSPNSGASLRSMKRK